MWLLLALAAALFQVLRNTAMKRLGHALDEYINVWGRFTFLLPFALGTCLLRGWPAIRPGFFTWCAVFGVSQTISTLALSKALKASEISLVTALWKVSLIILLGMAYVSIAQRARCGRRAAECERRVSAQRPAGEDLTVGAAGRALHGPRPALDAGGG